MPDRDGHDLIARVRAREGEGTARVPAIALTAFVRVADRARVLAAGYDMFVPKPVNPDELISTIGSLVGTGQRSRSRSSDGCARRSGEDAIGRGMDVRLGSRATGTARRAFTAAGHRPAILHGRARPLRRIGKGGTDQRKPVPLGVSGLRGRRPLQDCCLQDCCLQDCCIQDCCIEGCCIEDCSIGRGSLPADARQHSAFSFWIVARNGCGAIHHSGLRHR